MYFSEKKEKFINELKENKGSISVEFSEGANNCILFSLQNGKKFLLSTATNYEDELTWIQISEFLNLDLKK